MTKVVGVTPQGKEIQIYIDPKTAFRKLSFTSGGELPEQLSGIFTSEREAMRAVNDYVASRPIAKPLKEKTNGKSDG
jgi:hypothetical protein